MSRNFLRRVVLFLFLCPATIAQGYIDEVKRPLEIISGYKPNYFILGEPDAKVQLSLKAQFLRKLPIYLGYNQLMIWELFNQGSSPIKNIDFNPDLFYRLSLGPDKTENWLDLGAYDHESNGKSGNDSRSWVRVYLRWTRTFHTGEQTRLHVSLQAWVPYNYDPNNPGLANYRGLYEGTVTLSQFLGPFFERDDVTLRFYPGGSSDLNPLKGAQEITLRAKANEGIFLPLFVVQFFHGYAENLLNYNENIVAIRGGLGL